MRGLARPKKPIGRKSWRCMTLWRS
jgi:hypothetical protein